MSVLSPSFSVIAAIRADIVSILKDGGTPEALAINISPSLAIVNQWSSQIPLLLSVDNSGSCIDLVFAMRKDLFQGPLFSEASFGTPVADLPEPFQSFLNFTREIISAQKSEKSLQKVRFLCFNYLSDFIFIFSLPSDLERSSQNLLLLTRSQRHKLWAQIRLMPLAEQLMIWYV